MTVAKGDAEDLLRRQFESWGVRVQTSNVRAVHVLNGIVHLMRLLPSPPAFSDAESFDQYLKTLGESLGDNKSMPTVAKALCVTSRKVKGSKVRQALYLDGRPLQPKPPRYHREGLAHIQSRFVDAAEQPLSGLDPTAHDRFREVLNADGKVYDTGGEDPTSPGFALTGSAIKNVQTLKGLHALTTLGLLTATPDGCEALRLLHDLLRQSDDPHTRLLSALGVSQEAPAELPAGANLAGAFPAPSGEDWGALTREAGRSAKNLLSWCQRGLSKADTLSIFVDLALLLLLLRMLRWADSEPLLLLSPVRRSNKSAHRTLIAAARRSLSMALARLDEFAEKKKLIHEKTTPKGNVNRYPPAKAALNLGEAGGWLFPLDARGGARRFLSPGSRQLTTLVYALIEPGEQLAWSEFAARAEERLGLALGGPREHELAARVRVPSATAAIRTAGRVFRQQLVSLGLARQESDDVVMVDGGLE